MINRGHLLTEQPNPSSGELDALSIEQAFDVMNAEDRCVAGAVARAKPSIVQAVEMVAERMKRGGRLIYAGAGTSGRLGVLDASECPPTFLIPPDRVIGIIAGGDAALRRAAEQREDDAGYGAAEMDRVAVGADDSVMGIATGGTTPFVHGAIDRARALGAATIFFACVPFDAVGDNADVSIRVLTGPEVVSGSTRLKAGTATKLVLNTISTLVMVQLGKVYHNLMVDVNARGSSKLVDRALRTITAATGIDRAAAEDLLDRADWHVKAAIVMYHLGISRDEAQRRLETCGGHVRALVGSLEHPPCA